MRRSARRFAGPPRIVVFVAFLTILTGLFEVGGQERGTVFRFGYRPGEQYRIVGVNRQQLFVDGVRHGDAEILTRIRLRIGEEEARRGEAGARVSAEYRVSEEAENTGEPFSVDRDYQVSLWQDERGRQEVPAGAFVPQVRNVPVFPSQAVRPGDTWSAPGYEVQDFRDGLGVPEPVIVPVQVNYEYVGLREFEGREFHAIRIQYALFYRPPPGRPEAQDIRLMTARFDQELLWNNRAGRAHYYEETYSLFLQTTDGTRLEYRGGADGRVVDAPVLDREQVQRDIEDSINNEAIADTSVRSDEEGVTISLENIQFAPDSAELLASEIAKLEWLSEILARYPERDILVSGHTALAGTEGGRQRLSEERARAVVEYLIDAGVRERSQLMYRGFGARRPIAPNSTEEQRRRNRRVEITILEN